MVEAKHKNEPQPMLNAYLRAPAVSVKTRIQVHLERHWQDNRGREVWWGGSYVAG